MSIERSDFNAAGLVKANTVVAKQIATPMVMENILRASTIHNIRHFDYASVLIYEMSGKTRTVNLAICCEPRAGRIACTKDQPAVPFVRYQDKHRP
jgi:hypothetical protein